MKRNGSPVIGIILLCSVLLMTGIHAWAASPVYPEDELKEGTFRMPVIANATDHSTAGASTGATRDPGTGKSKGKTDPEKKPEQPGTGASEQAPSPQKPNPGTGTQTGKTASAGVSADKGKTGGANGKCCQCCDKCTCSGCGKSDAGNSKTRSTASGASTGVSTGRSSAGTSGASASTGRTMSAGTGAGIGAGTGVGTPARTGASTGASNAGSTVSGTGDTRTQATVRTTDDPESMPAEQTETEKHLSWWILLILIVVGILLLGFLFWLLLIRTGILSDWLYLLRGRFGKGEDPYADWEETKTGNMQIAPQEKHPLDVTDFMKLPGKQPGTAEKPDAFHKLMDDLHKTEAEKDETRRKESTKEASVEKNLQKLDQYMMDSITGEQQEQTPEQIEDTEMELAKQAAREQIAAEAKRQQKKGIFRHDRKRKN